MTLSLNKGSSLSLKKDDGSVLTNVRLGLGWDAAKRGLFGGGEIDLDASAVMLSGSNVVDTVYFGQLRSNDGSIVHSGDNLTGAGDGDDEVINVDLTRIPANVQSVVFVITSYSRQKFSTVKNVFARVIDATNGNKEVVRYNLAESANSTANVIAKITRDGNGWAFAAIGEFTDGKTAQDTFPVVKRHA